ncbi:hypothetical protein QYF61_018395 [Mycteria americana]|uniref:Synphilin-1 alpha-Synuclein-binding domain-containing protein n=1 Tax=Mycteria americana TaxID=33587 RepID=A0AAN7MJC2_MYCAM|nr:hypothetical protein QYF61_018395 [Mycteria americana]
MCSRYLVVVETCMSLASQVVKLTKQLKESPSQNDDTDELFYKELREISRSVALVLTGDFNFPDVKWDYHTADKNRSRKFLKHVENNFLVQIHLSLFNLSSLIHLLIVLMFLSGPTLGYLSIYVTYFYNQVLYLGSNILPQCCSPDGFASALPIVLLPLL